MTLEEKVAQLVGVWVGADAPAGASPRTSPTWSTGRRLGGGHPARARAAHPAVRHRAGRPGRSAPGRWPRAQAADRRGAAGSASRPWSHEECLTGFAAWRATVYPAPLGWGAAFDPELVEEMAGADRRGPCAPPACTRAWPRCWT